VCPRLSDARREQSAASCKSLCDTAAQKPNAAVVPALAAPATAIIHPSLCPCSIYLSQFPICSSAALHTWCCLAPSTVAASILPEHPALWRHQAGVPGLACKPLNRRSNCGTHHFPLPGHRAMISSRPLSLLPLASHHLAVRHAWTSLESLRFLRRVAASQNSR
jgi:hypothetical protein